MRTDTIRCGTGPSSTLLELSRDTLKLLVFSHDLRRVHRSRTEFDMLIEIDSESFSTTCDVIPVDRRRKTQILEFLFDARSRDTFEFLWANHSASCQETAKFVACV